MFGGKIRNPYEYPDRTQLQGYKFQIKKTKVSFSEKLWQNHKNVIPEKLPKYEQP